MNAHLETFLWGMAGGVVAVIACAFGAFAWLCAGGRAEDEEV